MGAEYEPTEAEIARLREAVQGSLRIVQIAEARRIEAEARATAAYAAGMEAAAVIAETQSRVGREWVPDSLWDNIIQRVSEAIRGSIPKPTGSAGTLDGHAQDALPLAAGAHARQEPS